MTTDRQVLGTTGATGSVTWPHLHYEVLYLDYPVAYISRKRVPLDKRINPETTFAPKRYEDGTSVRTLAWYRKNLKTSKSDKTDIQWANDYLLTQLSEIEDDDEYEDADENRVELVPVWPEDKISVVPPRVAIYHVESEVAMRTNSFRAKPQQSWVLPMIQLYRSGIEFDLHGYSLTEETWIKNNLAKLANYIINTARELTSSDYQKFIMPLLNQYGIQYEASNYHSDLSIILKLCSLIRGWNASSSSAQISAGWVVSNPGSNTKEVKKQNIVIDWEFRTKVEKIHQPLTNKSTILEALGIDNYKHIPRILDNFKEYKTYVLDPTNDSESIIWARKYYLLSSKVARDIMNQFYLPKPNEKWWYVERQKQYVGRFKDFASAMSIVYGKAISQPPTIEKDIAIWALIIADNNKTIVNLEKIINK